MKKKNLRSDMPKVSEFIDAMREAFGTEMINEQIRKGMRGEPVFYAVEGGHQVGTKIRHSGAIAWNESGISIDVSVKEIGHD